MIKYAKPILIPLLITLFGLLALEAFISFDKLSIQEDNLPESIDVVMLTHKGEQQQEIMVHKIDNAIKIDSLAFASRLFTAVHVNEFRNRGLLYLDIGFPRYVMFPKYKDSNKNSVLYIEVDMVGNTVITKNGKVYAAKVPKDLVDKLQGVLLK